MKNFIRTMMATAVMAIFCFVGQAVAEITVASWGGAYTMSQQKAYADTFSDSPLVEERRTSSITTVAWEKYVLK